MVQYYFLKDLKQIGKREDENYYLFDEDRGWIADEEKRIIDRLIGFDSTKPEDSNSRIGNLEIIKQIRELSPESVIDILTKR
ncbi:MAG: hypothetical protein Q4G11_02775 [Gallicola sp.]|nr:hypothetical protein [Gallicola sp.]